MDGHGTAVYPFTVNLSLPHNDQKSPTPHLLPRRISGMVVALISQSLPKRNKLLLSLRPALQICAYLKISHATDRYRAPAIHRVSKDTAFIIPWPDVQAVIDGRTPHITIELFYVPKIFTAPAPGILGPAIIDPASYLDTQFPLDFAHEYHDVIFSFSTGENLYACQRVLEQESEVFRRLFTLPNGNSISLDFASEGGSQSLKEPSGSNLWGGQWKFHVKNFATGVTRNPPHGSRVHPHQMDCICPGLTPRRSPADEARRHLSA
ncbi:hypothetical protein BOTBODRAFT_49727 [Botryobasidium botryosum FD-172 SS1]|uniref:BTB domain-containing protein n=1 Tax=Botryobasidium botryosum (strain FD-172 SS1) TaxID=930990 RepID=A0A067M2C5_BOTB1|nr:hypothetical protein BOTBODRAFT_49727 [Botryobasidium botryosum FD-172 SS1]